MQGVWASKCYWYVFLTPACNARPANLCAPQQQRTTMMCQRTTRRGTGPTRTLWHRAQARDARLVTGARDQPPTTLRGGEPAAHAKNRLPDYLPEICAWAPSAMPDHPRRTGPSPSTAHKRQPRSISCTLFCAFLFHL
jgi:hypothetical protein